MGKFPRAHPAVHTCDLLPYYMYQHPSVDIPLISVVIPLIEVANFTVGSLIS